MIFGYARVSSEGQSLETQLAALEAAGCEVIRAEKRTGTTTDGRTELRTILDFVREGDVLIVTRLDRLARNTRDLLDVGAQLQARGAGLRSLGEPWADTTTPAGRMIMTVFAGIAEFETALRRERQMEGIRAAQARGIYTGGHRKLIDDADLRARIASGKPIAAIARDLGVGRQTIYARMRELKISRD